MEVKLKNKQTNKKNQLGSFCLCLSHLVSDSLPAVVERFETLLRLSASRRVALEDQLRLYVFQREAEELQTWLTSRKAEAEAEDCGQDLEDVEVSHTTAR